LLHHLVRQHRLAPLAEPLLTLGVQDVLATYDELKRIFEVEGVVPREVPPQDRQPTTSLIYKRLGEECGGFVHARTFFRMLGIDDYHDLDASTAEGPMLVHDLNEPVPPQWHGRFGTILDAGTLEHIFDLRTALANIVRLLRVGGAVLHISPLSGWVNHGFIQVSPCLYYDYYQANGFQVRDACVLRLKRRNFRAPGLFMPYQHELKTFSMDDREHLSLLAFTATKQQVVHPLRVPIQSKYRPRFLSAPSQSSTARTA
jgi:hypothetical protein